ncbi:MAG TPA: TonB-dependent receptor [Steroidobacteraceae bacterium]|jgi:outer membrane receptor protein involved in Fe transport
MTAKLKVVADSVREARPGVRYLVHAAIAVALATATAHTAWAQTAPAARAATGDLEEIVVTGSRIQRSPDLESSSPLVSISQDTLTNISTVGVENALNQMPQFVPAQTQFITNDNSPSATNVPGAATINLRGLGTNRTLVLLDGRRAQPANIALVVDVNSIPSAAIDHVEVVTGGASAVYGADAISGVVNFRLKQHFQGAEIDAQSGLTEAGDGAESRISATLGTDFAEHKGNIITTLEWAKRDSAYQNNRDFYTNSWTDPLAGAGQRNMFAYNDYLPAGTNLPSAAVSNGLFGTTVDNTTGYIFNDGASSIAGTTLFKSDVGCTAKNGNNATVGFNGVVPAGVVLTAQPSRCGSLNPNYTGALVSSPLTRYSMFTKVNYELNDHLTAFFQGNFESNNVLQNVVYTAARSGWAIQVPYCNPANMGTYTATTCAAANAAYPVPTQLASLLNSRVSPSATWTLESTTVYAGPKISTISTKVFQVMAGLDGTLPFKDWNWEAYASHGETNSTDAFQSGYMTVQNYISTLLSAANGGKANPTTGAYGAGYTQAGYSPSIGASVSCASGLPVFSPYAFKPSADCLQTLQARLNSTTGLQQDIVEASAQGGILNLPAGEVRGSVGLDWRKDYGVFTPDSVLSSSSVNENIANGFATAAASGETEVKEAYGELLVPLLKDLPAIKSLNLELGDRESKYNTAGKTQTWKALLNWAPTSFLTFRGGVNYAVRAPNVAELFVGNTVTTSSLAPYGDPCIAGGPTGKQVIWGNNVNNPNLTQALALCRALISGTHANSGIGTAAANAIDLSTWQGGLASIITNDTLVVQGNSALKPEKAHTATIGMVLRSPFESAALRTMTATVDYYKIHMTDTVGTIDSLTAYQNCFNYNGTSNPGYDPNNSFCNLITRDSGTGARSSTAGVYTNLGTLKTEGLDFAFNWRAALEDMFGHGAGALGFHVSGTWLLSYKQQTAPGAATFEYAGTGSFYSYRTLTGLSYDVGPATMELDWTHLPSIENTVAASTPTTPILPTSAYNTFNLNAGWEFSNGISMRLGIDNLMNRQAPVVGSTPGTTDAAGVTNPSIYDVLGRRYYLSVRAKF